MNVSSSSRGVDREGAPARVIWLPLGVVLAATLAGFGLVWSVRSELPDPVARHWGADGRPDGFSSLNSQLVFGLLFCLGMPLLMFGLGAGMRQLRAMGTVAAGLAVFLSTLLFGGLYAQRGLDSATAASASWPMWLGFTAGPLVGLLVWLGVRDTTPHVATTGPTADAPRVRVAPGARVAWTGSTRAGRGSWVAAVLGLVPTLAMGIMFATFGDRSAGVLMLLLTLAMAALLSNLRCRVTIDSRGVRALGLGFVPWVRIGLDHIEEATLETVSPLGDFGGWGYRSKLDASGSWGLVTSGGEALVIERAGKGPFYLTVDGAREAASVVNTLVARTGR